MASEVVQLERRNLDENLSHKSQHEPDENCDEEEDKEDQEKEEFVSKFAPNFRKTTWISKIEKIMSQTNRSEVIEDGVKYTQVAYSASTTFDVFYSNRVKIFLPRVRIKEDLKGRVRICWTNSPGINFCVRYQNFIGEVKINDFDSGWVDDFLSWNTDRSFNHERDFSIGNIPEVTHWSMDVLEPKNCLFTIPFHYTYKKNVSIPMHLLPKGADVTHVLTFYQDPLLHLLRLEVLYGDQWTPVATMNMIGDFVDCDEFQDPILTAKYVHLSDMERSARRKEAKENKFIIPVHEVITVKSPNELFYGKKGEIPLRTDVPVFGVFFKSVNVVAESNNNRCNYSSNPYDIRLGKFPTSENSLFYEKLEKFKLSPEMMSCTDLRENFRNIPSTPGRWAYAISLNPFETTGQVGVIFSQKISVHLQSSYQDPNGVKIAERKTSEKNQDRDALIKMVLRKTNSSVAASSSSSDIVDKNNPFRTEVRLLTSRELHFSFNKEKGDFIIELI